MLRLIAMAVFIVILSSAVLAASEEKSVIALPKVPSRATIVKDLKNGESESKRVSDWVQVFIEAKEKKARAELEVLREKYKLEEATREYAEKERKRREERQNQRWGSLGPKTVSADRKSGVRLKVDFVVPEVETYRIASDIYRTHQALCNDIVEVLSKLDRDADGRLTVEEYRDVAALVNSSGRIFLSMDKNNDGMITEGEIEQMLNVPANAAAALRLGRPAEGEAEVTRIKVWDADNDGELNVNERKALSMNFVTQSLRATENAAFYRNVADTLSAARNLVATKFSELEILP